MANPSNAFLRAFGAVINQYASCEEGIKIALSGMLDIDLGALLILSEPYSAAQLKNVAKSVAKEVLKPDLAEKFCCIVGDWSAHSTLRNLIAHSRWTSGQQPDSLKPMRVSIREGRANWFGHDDSETDYTVADIEKAALSLAQINLRTFQFLKSSGLQRIIDAKIEAANSDKSDSSGSDGSSASK